MSRLIEKLNRIARVTAQPMGFGANRAASSTSRMLLIAGLAGGEDTADAVLLPPEESDAGAAALKKTVGALSDVPWGCWAAANDKKTEMLVAAGSDFLIFTAESPVVSTPEDDNIGRVLQVDMATDDSLLRAVNDLPVDAVLAAGEDKGNQVDWRYLMRVQRLSNLLSRPLLVAVPAKITDAEIRALWEAGVDGIVTGAEATTDQLEKLRRIIDGLPPRSAHRRGKNEALLPRISASTSAAADEEEEDEDWDDE